MKFIVLVEGSTEKNSLPGFLSRWLNPRLPQKVRIEPQVVSDPNDLIEKAKKHLGDSKAEGLIAVIGLLDLQGLKSVARENQDKDEYYEHAMKQISDAIGSDRFRMFFAVHEIEAWLFSQPDIFPREVQDAVKAQVKSRKPEAINFDNKPSKVLKDIYRGKMKSGKSEYRKIIDGATLFSNLDPNIAYDKCPHLQAMLDEMLLLAQNAK